MNVLRRGTMTGFGRDRAERFSRYVVLLLAVFSLLFASVTLNSNPAHSAEDDAKTGGGSSGSGQSTPSGGNAGGSNGADSGNGGGKSNGGKADQGAAKDQSSGSGSSSGQPSEAPAAPAPTKADILALEAAQKALTKAKVRYAQAELAHKSSMKQVRKMKKEAATARLVATDARRDLGNMARLAYTSGNGSLNVLAGLISAQTPEDLMDRATAAERLSDHQDAEFTAADATRATAERLSREAVRFFKAAEDELAASKQDLKETKALAGSLSLENKFNISGKPVDLKTKSEWVFPIPGAEIGSEAGMRLHPILGYTRCHAGADISAPSGTAIHSVDDGVVVSATGDSGGYGNYTVISHGRGLTSAYAHQTAMVVEAGDQVTRGQIIGTVGSTGLSSGPHLHFEARYFGDPYNPRGWLQDIPELRVPSC